MSILDIKYDEVEFQEVARDGRTYACKFGSKIVAQSPKITMASCLLDPQGDKSPFAYFELDKASMEWLAHFEGHVIHTAIERKGAWFKKDLPDEFISTSFKSSIKEDGRFCTKIAEDFEVYTHKGEPVEDLSSLAPGVRVVALLELGQITFGKIEFGCLWKLKQLVVVPSKTRAPCLIQYTEEESQDDEYFL